MNINSFNARSPSPNLLETPYKSRLKSSSGSSFNNNKSEASSSTGIYKSYEASKDARSRSRSSSRSSSRSITPNTLSTTSIGVAATAAGGVNTNIRYSRSALYFLRNDTYSRRRPECSLRTELESLGVWKFNSGTTASASISGGNSGSSHQNGNNISHNNNGHELSADVAQTTVSSSSSTILGPCSSHSQHARPQRSPAGAASYHNSHSYTHAAHQQQHHTLQKSNSSSNYLDHRSISSAHLMPAFAKRRIAASGGTVTAAEAHSSVTQNILTGAIGAVCNPSSSGADARTDTPTHQEECKEVVGRAATYRQQQRNKEHQHGLYEYRHGARGGSESGTGATYLSPNSNRMGDYDRERVVASPVSSASSLAHGRHGAVAGNHGHERRIGSGRLLPRDVNNWSDFPTARGGGNNLDNKDEKKIQTNLLASDVQLPANRSSTGTGRGIFERNSNKSSSAGGGGDTAAVGFMERRSFDRRSGTSSNDDKYEHSSHSRRATSTQDMLPPLQQQHRHNRRQQSHGGHHGHHNSYNEREEPEWFSGGPTSQHDTIELRGFDEIDENYGPTNSSSSTRNKLQRHAGNSNVPTRKLNEISTSRGSNSLNLASTTAQKQQKTTYGSGSSDTDLNVYTRDSSPKREKGNDTSIPVVSASEYDSDDSVHSIGYFLGLSTDDERYERSENRAGFRKDIKKSTQKHVKRDAKSFSAEEKEQLRLNVVKKECGEIFADFFSSKHADSTSTTNVAGTTNEVTNIEKEQQNHELLNVFFNSDSLEHTLLQGASSHGNDSHNSVGISSSRFSRWFATKTTNDNSNKPPVADNVIQFFSSKLDLTEKPLRSNIDATLNNTLLEFLQRNKLPTHALHDGVTRPNVSAIPSVEELEARMRHIDSNGNSGTTTINKDTAENHLQSLNTNDISKIEESQTHGDVEAFKKLLEQLGTSTKQQQQLPMHMMLSYAHNGPHCSTGVVPPPPPPHSQMSLLLQTGINPAAAVDTTMIASGPPPLAMPHQKEEVRKIIQQQQQLFHHPQSKPIFMQQPISPQHMPHTIGNDLSAPNPLLPHHHLSPSAQFAAHLQPQQKCLEAQHLFQSVLRGEIAVSFLEQELASPNITPHAREIIMTVLRESTRSVTPSTGLNQPPQPTAIVTRAPASSTQAVILPHHTNSQQHHSPAPSQAGAFVAPPNMLLSNAVLMPGVHPSPMQQQASQQTVGVSNNRDLQYHTQTIMQNALLKKKLEEQQQQQESFRKRQQTHIILNQLDTQQPKSMLQQPQQPLHLQQPRHVNSPTPLAFTPTSVLRKMTADKENSVSSSMTSSGSTSTNNVPQHQPKPQAPQQQQQRSQAVFLNQPQSTNTVVPQPRMILGVGNTALQQQQQNNGSQISPQQLQQQQPVSSTQLRNAPQQQQLKWPVGPHQMPINQMIQPTSMKPLGRPILKGPAPATSQQQALPTVPPQQQQQQVPQMTFAAKLEFQQISQQQQQRLKNNQTPQHMLNHHQQQVFTPQPTHTTLTQQQQQQLYQQHQQQQRVLALQRQQHLQQQMQQQHHNQQQQQQMQQHQTNQQQFDATNRTMGPLLAAANENVVQNSTTSVPASSGATASPTTQKTATVATGIINYQRDGGLSPTSNQLAQWFSPELLAQASAGKLPLLNMNQALSLEEFERSIQQHSSSTAVHN